MSAATIHSRTAIIVIAATAAVHRSHQVVDGACAVDHAIAVGYLRGRTADADRRHDGLTAVTHLLRAWPPSGTHWVARPARWSRRRCRRFALSANRFRARRRLLLPSVLDTAASSAPDGARPLAIGGIPGPCAGAPNTFTLRVESPSGTVVVVYTSGAAAVTPGIRATIATSLSGNGGDPMNGPAGPDLTRYVSKPKCVDGVVGFHAKTVGESGENKRHREHQAGADDGDDEAPSSPLQVAQRHTQHVVTLPSWRSVRAGVCRIETNCDENDCELPAVVAPDLSDAGR